ncbi:SLATT domain-containing protein [Pyxidicoccus parkwayensis]|uniref:SLATT domain-containing protein n=1 Tax=Pyxidicoccus parkwayensis TaxID=2813578 RepID=A0ABX7NVB6_9BACT|nr:SLATT domain-containing protein [Pyxidicoccus parkwaysis]QSQ22871.1 SLATT domain-containing protein [Pyxidicoccus parkwaysis]
MTDDTTDDIAGPSLPEAAPRKLSAAEKKRREPLVAEAQRIQENAQHTATAHFHTSERLARHHSMLGSLGVVVAALLAANGGAEVFGKGAPYAWVTPILSFVAAVTTALLTFLKISERQARHLTAAHAFKTLENQARRLATMDAEFEAYPSLKRRVDALCERWDTLLEQGPPTVTADFEVARKRIAEGIFKTEVDSKLAEGSAKRDPKTQPPPT